MYIHDAVHCPLPFYYTRAHTHTRASEQGNFSFCANAPTVYTRHDGNIRTHNIHYTHIKSPSRNLTTAEITAKVHTSYSIEACTHTHTYLQTHALPMARQWDHKEKRKIVSSKSSLVRLVFVFGRLRKENARHDAENNSCPDPITHSFAFRAHTPESIGRFVGVAKSF